MQLYSKAFKKMVKQFFDSENRVIATMSSIYECPFIDAIRKRKDVTLIEVTPQNRENLLTELVEELKK
jgi:nucleoside-triphosphatase THEP1